MAKMNMNSIAREVSRLEGKKSAGKRAQNLNIAEIKEVLKEGLLVIAMNHSAQEIENYFAGLKEKLIRDIVRLSGKCH